MTAEQFLVVLALLLIAIIGGMGLSSYTAEGHGWFALFDMLVLLMLWAISLSSLIAAFIFTFRILTGV